MNVGVVRVRAGIPLPDALLHQAANATVSD